MQSIFDGHNDLLSRLWEDKRSKKIDPVSSFLKGKGKEHINASYARSGGMVGGFCAIFVPPTDCNIFSPLPNKPFKFPISPPLDRHFSLDVAIEQFAIAFQLHQKKAWRICRNYKDIEKSIEEGLFAALLHIEGCEAFDDNLSTLELFYAAGLRSLGPAWSRNTIFAHGVPFACPENPETGPGLTQAGFELVRACNRLGVIIDVSHLTAQGFRDIEKTSTQPLVATHSNAHHLSPVARNLMDWQLDAIRERKGIVGFCFSLGMIQGQCKNEDLSIEQIVNHLNYLVDKVGIDCVALGSDFDGATISSEIGNASGLQLLVEGLEAAGYDTESIIKICRGNWFRLLKLVLKDDE